MAAPDQNVGGVDVADKLAMVFNDQNTRMSEVFTAHQNFLTSLSQRLLGGIGPQNPQQNTAVAGMVTSSTLGQTAPPSLGPGNTRGAVPLGAPGPGGTTTATLGAQQGQGSGGAPIQGAAGLRLPPTMIPAGPPAGTPSTSGQGGNAGAPPIVPQGGGAPAPSSGTPSSGGGTPPGTPSSTPAPRYGNPALGSFGGNGLVGHLWQAAKGAIPALGMVQDAQEEYLSWKNKNLYYAAQGGDTTWTQEQRDRFAEEVAVFGHPTTLSSSEARQAFKTATAMGFTGNMTDPNSANRTDIVDYVANAKNTYGADTSESLRTLQLLIGNGQTSKSGLQVLVDTLGRLNAEAGKAGANVSLMRQQFNAYFQAAATGGNQGTNATMVAGLVSQGQAELGKTFQHLDFSGQMGNQSYRYMVAGAAGMTLGQLNAAETTNPVAAAQARTQMLGRPEDYLAQASPQGWARLQQQVQMNAANIQRDPDMAHYMATQWWRQDSGNADPNVFLQLMQSFSGVQHFTSAEDGLAYLITQMNPQTSAVGVARRAQNSMGAISASGREANGRVATTAGGARMGSGFIHDAMNNSDTGRAYAASIKGGQSHRYGSVVDLLHTLGSSADDQRVMVQTSRGYRAMSLRDALKSDFAAQVATGQATFLTGKYQGKSITDIVGGASTDSASRALASKSQHEKGRGSLSMNQEMRQHKGEGLLPSRRGGGAGGRIQIDLTPAARKLITAQHVEDAQGQPRSNTHSSSGDYIASNQGLI